MIDALIGDSQAAGLEAPLRARVQLAFAEPHVGWTTARVFGDPLAHALASGATRVIAVTGGNDDPLNVAAFADGVARARRAGKQLVIVGPVFAKTDDAARHDRARAALKAAARAADVRFIDAYPLTQDLARTSNVHLGPGYPEYARRLAAALQGSSSGLLVAAGAVAAVAAVLASKARS